MIKHLLFALLFCPLLSFAQEFEDFENEEDIFDVPQVVAVQNRIYDLNQGLTLKAGYLPLDNFTKGFNFGASYTYYFSDFTGWEVVNANYVLDSQTSLAGQLDSFGVQAETLPEFIDWYATTNIAYTPFYNKSLLFNRSVVWGETTFLVGGGAGNFTRSGVKPLLSLGVILKYFLGPRTAFKVEVRDHIAFLDGGIESYLAISLGYSFQLGGRKSGEEHLIDEL